MKEKKPPRKKAKAPAKAKKPARQATPKKKPKPKPKPPNRRKDVPLEDRPLSGKQKLFGDWYTSAEVNCNGTEAARRAGYKGSDATLAAIASENLKKPNVRRYIDQRLAEAAKGAEVTVENVLKKLQTVFELGVKNSQLAAAARAAELQGKYLKMFTDKIEHTQTLEDVSTEDLVRLLSEITENGLDLNSLIAGNGTDDSGLSDPAGTETTH